MDFLLHLYQGLLRSLFHSALLIIFPLYVVLASLSFILSISGFCNGPCESFSVLTSPSETVFVMNDHADLFIFLHLIILQYQLQILLLDLGDNHMQLPYM